MNEKTEMTAVEEPPVSKSYPELFHYTSLGALAGILESRTLWATHAKHLNDSSELELMWDKITPHLSDYILRAASIDPDRFSEHQDTIDRLGGIENIAAGDADTLVQIMRSQLFGDGEKSGFGAPFIACFTTHIDQYDRSNGLLSQWRGYGDEGVAIVFDTSKLEELLKREHARFHYSSFSLADAVYYESRLGLEKWFPRLFGALDSASTVIVDGLPEGIQTHEAFENITRELLPAVGRLKHWGFREEKEWRIIVGVPDPRHFDGIAKSLIGHQEFKEVCFRSGRCGSIPYIKLFEGIGDLPISKILVGPSRNQDANVGKVATLLQELAPGQASSHDLLAGLP